MASAELSQVYIEAATVPTAVPAELSQVYVEAATVPATVTRQLTQVYLEVLTPVRQAFIGWGVPA